MLSDQELAILRALHKDGRRSFREISKEVGQPESTVRYQLTRLIESGQVSINVIPDPQALGYQVWVCIGLHVDMRYHQEIIDYLKSFQEVYFVALSAGGYDILLNAVFRSNDHLLAFLTKDMPNIEGIRSISTHIILHVAKRELSLLPQHQD